MMLEKIKKYCERHQLLETGDMVLIACSGGSDSLALAEVLLALREHFGLILAVGHVNHMFRGVESDGDACFVATFCAERGLPYYETKVDVPAYCETHRLSKEEGARVVRYAFLRETAKMLGGAKIATGHHRDDQAETVLMHLIRGAGSGGIGGIPARNQEIIRPLLAVSREEIERYCEDKRLMPRTDSTNFETDYVRNRIRLNLLPEMAAHYNPVIKDALCRTAELVSTEHAFVRENAANIWNAVIVAAEKKIIFRRDELSGLHPALKRELARMAIESLQGNLKGIGFDHVESLLRFCDSGKVGALLELPGNLILRCGYRTAELFFREALIHGTRVGETETLLYLPGLTKVPQCGISIKAALLERYERPMNKWTTIFDPARLLLPLYVRQRRDGDRFQPDGMHGTKKLKDFLIDMKVERGKRDTIPLVCDQAGILWVGGYRRSRRGAVTEGSTKFLQLAIVEDEIGEAEIYNDG